MNNFKTTADGGMPLVLNDFRFINDSQLQALKGIVSVFGVTDQTAVILSGCERTILSGTVTIASGYISLGGEICFVPSHSYPVPSVGNFEYWVLNVSFDTAGLKLYKNTDSNETYEERTGKINVSNVVPDGHTKYQDAKRYEQVINEFITAQRVNELLNFSLINQNTNTVPIGVPLPYFGTVSNIPAGYLLCDGSLKLVADYPALHLVIGYQSGGSGPNFNLPNLIDNVLMGANAAGAIGGSNEVTIANGNLPEHTHSINDPGHSHSHDSYIKSGDGYVDGNDNGDNALQGNSASSGTASSGTGITIQNGGGVASPAPLDITPKHVKCLWIMRT